MTSLVLLAAAPLLSLPALLSVSAMLLGVVVLAAVFVLLGQARVVVERRFAPEVLSPGDTTTATVEVTNLSVLPALEARWSDTVPHGLSADASGVLPPLGGSRTRRSRARFRYPVQGLRRGRHALGPLRVEVVDPFGLVLRRHTFGDAQDLVVLPRRHALDAGSTRGLDEGVAAQGAAHRAGIGEDDLVARTYLPGDALKRMHWKATAHRGELMVRQEEQQDDPRIGVVVDPDAASFGTASRCRAPTLPTPIPGSGPWWPCSGVPTSRVPRPGPRRSRAPPACSRSSPPGRADRRSRCSSVPAGGTSPTPPTTTCPRSGRAWG